MKIKSFGRDPRRGSALLASMIVVVVLSFAAAGILSYSLNTYRNSVRQQMMDQAKELADSEMENLYFVWQSGLMAKVPVANVEFWSPNMTTLLASNAPFSQNFQNPPWTIQRTLQFVPVGAGDGSAQGLVPDTLQIGKNYYFTATTSASITLPLLGTITAHSGRHFVYSSTSLFQFAVFYQGNLEMAAGGNMTINGPVSTNASAYLGAQANNGNPFTLTLTDSVYYFQNFNGASNPLLGETDLLQGTSTLVDPVYNPNPKATPPEDQAAQRALQVQKLSSQSSFIGGVDVIADVANPSYQAAYTNSQTGAVDPNEVYRAVIAPPPTLDGALLPEDPVVAASRMYNSAGILITIEQTASGAPNVGTNTTINVGTAQNPTAYNNDPNFATIVHPNANVDSNGHPTSIVQNVRTQFVDPRELLNGSTAVNLTTVDIGNLNIAIAAAMTTDTTLASNYNGVVYVYDKTVDGTSAAPGIASNTLNGIRLTDGTTTPNYPDQNGNPLGFSVVSDNGVYVQGDYNTTLINAPGATVPVTNPAAIMGDAVTALSQGWSLTNNATLQDYSNREATNSTVVPANPLNSIVEPASTPQGIYGMTVNAAILTGNTPTFPSTSTSNGWNSGGAQNLVRMVEDWFYPNTQNGGPGMTLQLNGSLGQLFSSKYFSGEYASGQQQGLGPALNGGWNRVYIQPKTRIVNYDLGFKQRTPAGSPTTTGFSRGDFFFW